jgi:hypothetical protein
MRQSFTMLLVLARTVILRSESRGIHDHILLSHIRDSPNLGVTGLRIYIPQEQVGPVIPPGTAFSFRYLLRLAGLRWRYSYLTGNTLRHRYIAQPVNAV